MGGALAATTRKHNQHDTAESRTATWRISAGGVVTSGRTWNANWSTRRFATGPGRRSRPRLAWRDPVGGGKTTGHRASSPATRTRHSQAAIHRHILGNRADGKKYSSRGAAPRIGIAASVPRALRRPTAIAAPSHGTLWRRKASRNRSTAARVPAVWPEYPVMATLMSRA